jgi:hypothetical protein
MLNKKGSLFFDVQQNRVLCRFKYFYFIFQANGIAGFGIMGYIHHVVSTLIPYQH